MARPAWTYRAKRRNVVTREQKVMWGAQHQLNPQGLAEVARREKAERARRRADLTTPVGRDAGHWRSKTADEVVADVKSFLTRVEDKR